MPECCRPFIGSQPHQLIREVRPQREAQMVVWVLIIGAVAAILIIPTKLSAQGVGGTVSTAVSRGIPTAGDLERSSRSANNYRTLHKHTTPTKSRRRAQQP